MDQVQRKKSRASYPRVQQLLLRQLHLVMKIIFVVLYHVCFMSLAIKNQHHIDFLLISAVPIDCQWKEFENWSACSKTCGDGMRTRSRNISIQQAHGGKNCTGLSTDFEVCNIGSCPGDIFVGI